MRNWQNELMEIKGRCCTKQHKTVYKHPIHCSFWGWGSDKKKTRFREGIGSNSLKSEI